MNPALWIAKTGLDAQQTRMSVVANNLANVNTTGYKRDRASFEDLLYQQVRAPGGASSQQTVDHFDFDISGHGMYSRFWHTLVALVILGVGVAELSCLPTLK